MLDEIGSSTLMGCGFKIVKGEPAVSEERPRTLFPPVRGTLSSGPSIDVLL